MFYTLNGKYVGVAFNELDLESYRLKAAISFANSHFHVSVNFGTKNFKFGIEDMLSNHYKEIYEEICAEQIDSKQVFDLVHDYLIHSGFVGTLQAFEDESSFALIKDKKVEKEEQADEFDKLHSKAVSYMPRKKTLGPDMLVGLSARNRPSESVLTDNIAESYTARENEEEKEVLDVNQQPEGQNAGEDKQAEQTQNQKPVEEIKMPAPKEIHESKLPCKRFSDTYKTVKEFPSGTIKRSFTDLMHLEHQIDDSKENKVEVDAEMKDGSQLADNDQNKQEVEKPQDGIFLDFNNLTLEPNAQKEDVQQEVVKQEVAKPVEDIRKDDPDEEMIDTSSKVKKDQDVEMVEERHQRKSEVIRSDVIDEDKSEDSDAYEFDPFFGRTVSTGALNAFSKIQQRSGRSESIRNPILTSFWRLNETGDNWKKIKPDNDYMKLEERGFIRHLLLEGMYDEALTQLKEHFGRIVEKEPRIQTSIN